MNDTIRRWTRQGHDFDLPSKSGPIDLSRSQYATLAGYVGREPTWADAVAHMPHDLQERWRRVVASMGQRWSETHEPIAEPWRVK